MSSADSAFDTHTTIRHVSQWAAAGRRTGEGSPKKPTGSFSLPMKCAMTTVAFVGLVLTTYLSWVSLTSGKVAGCGSGGVFDCGHVMQTKWSSVAGVPVGVPAAFLYLSLLSALMLNFTSRSRRVHDITIGVVSITAFAAAAAAVWFVGLQLFVVEHLCGYCLAAHLCGLTLAALVIWSSPLNWSRLNRSALLSAAAVATMATVQIMSAPPQTFKVETFTETADEGNIATEGESEFFAAPGVAAPVGEQQKVTPQEQNETTPESIFEAPSGAARDHERTGSEGVIPPIESGRWMFAAMQLPPEDSTNTKQSTQDKDTGPERLVSIAGGRIQLRAAHWPMIGADDARLIFVEMFDYTCPHCRENHRSVKKSLSQFDDDVAIIALSVPLNAKCNSSVQTTNPTHAHACELSRLSVAVWRVDPSKFSAYHDWLFSGPSAPTADVAMKHAERLVGSSELRQELDRGMAAKYVARQVELYQSIGAGNVPKLLFPGTTVTGTVASVDVLTRIIREQLNSVPATNPEISQRN